MTNERAKKDWTGNRSSTFKMLGASNHADHERQEHDYYATDPNTVDRLFGAETFSQNILEPACGEGHLSKRMEELGKTVESSDLIDRGYGTGVADFLSRTEPFMGDIVTNPPYRYAQEFCEKAIELSGGKAAMFLKLTFLEGQKRRKFFAKNPPRYVYVFSDRQLCAINGDFSRKMQSATAYAWFVWEKGFVGNPEIKWL